MIEEENNEAVTYEEILHHISVTYEAKNADYGDSFHKLCEQYGWSYALAHMEEKIARIKTLSRTSAHVMDEGMEDSLLDLAGYAILTYMEYVNGNEGLHGAQEYGR